MLRVTKTENGVVQGIPAADPRITAFKGIPFAAPPVGENRWRAPQPCSDWEGTLLAQDFAPISVQDTPGIGDNIYIREWHVDKDIPMDEDCLYLNVWTGANEPKEKRPVVVWFFGGMLQWGYPAEMEFDGERLARRGIVVVTVNYRLNVFGFLSHPDLTKEAPAAPANFGCLDQQFALDWVIRNIENFGGDPENITLAGQSAGGGSVLSQWASEHNRGHFKRVIIESAMIRSPYGEIQLGIPETLEKAEELGLLFFHDYLGVDTIEEARRLDPYFIRDKYAEYAEKHPRFLTVLDHQFTTGDPIAMFKNGELPKVPVLSGNTGDEFLNFISADSDDQFANRSKEIFGDKAAKFLDFDEAWQQPAPNQYATVNGISCTVKSVFQHQPKGSPNCYYYQFDADVPGDDHPGTFHSVELWFFFETLAKCSRPFKGVHYDLARLMCNYWTNFVKCGNPNGNDADGTPMPEWKPYTKEQNNRMIFKTSGPSLENTPETKFQQFLIDKIALDLSNN